MEMLERTGSKHSARGGIVAALAIGLTIATALAAPTVPTDVQQPGTQPGDGIASFATNCDSCHATTPTPNALPSNGWHGSMMSHSMRDPIFWATVAVAEQDFLPHADPAQRGGVGDLCLRCHGPNGWLGGRSTPTDGSAFTGSDDRGVECEHCHLQVNPDAAVNVVGTTEEQNSPFEAYDAVDGEPYIGSGMYVLNSGGTRVGPYDDAVANHAFLQSSFMRSGDMCGTCHDVSNPAVGDLAHNHGAQVPLAPGTYSGVPGAPVEQKAAFNNPPYAYGVVERTYSEWKAGALDTFAVNDFTSLPADLQVAGGALEVAYQRATAANGDADYVDGTPRLFTCQTCHMSPTTSKGCNKNQAPVRTDMPEHDLAGGGYWMPDAMLHQYDNGRLRFGAIDSSQRAALTESKQRAAGLLRSAAALDATQAGSQLVVRVTNLTGHKLISGYPEGRRMWLNLRWFDGGGSLVREDGAYGPNGRSVNDLSGTPHAVQTILDPENTTIYEAKPGMDQAWAAQLIALGYATDLALDYDPLTDAVKRTLGDLAAEPDGSVEHTFHFVLNNVVTDDDRIPPYGFAYDDARTRNSLPVPASRYGDPGPGGVYRHWDERGFEIPVGAASVQVRLLYQQTSWEYVQFLWLANDGLSPFLGAEGVNMLDAWLNTGMSPPFEMATVSAAVTGGIGAPGEASPQDSSAERMRASWNAGTGRVEVAYSPACDATGHTIRWGDLSSVSSYGYAGAECAVGASGVADFDPGASSVFFLIVADNASSEGSYGRDATGTERPEADGPTACDFPQDLTATCN